MHKYVSDAAEKEDSFDQVLVPMIENVLNSILLYIEVLLFKFLF